MSEEKIVSPKYYQQAMAQCPYFSDLNKKEQNEYISLAPFKNRYRWWFLLLLGLLPVIIYNVYMNDQITKFNLQFKQMIDEKKAKQPQHPKEIKAESKA